MSFDLTKHWYQRQLSWLSLLLLPFSWLFRLIVIVRRGLYRTGILKAHKMSVPVIVVGNIAVGGTGKTPFVIWLVDYLKQQGYRPGIISRGAGGQKQTKPHLVRKNDLPEQVGDESLLLASHANCPLVIGINRVEAARYLLASSDCNIIISDDGLQHYRLKRDVELVIVDGVRRFGNQQLLPAGPLRESVSRLKEVDEVIVNGEEMQLVPGDLVALTSRMTKPLSDLRGETVHAVAGIGHPERFFLLLEQAGLKVMRHAFPDHYLYQASDLAFQDDLPVLMTEKDAVKCLAWARDSYWYLPVQARVDAIVAEKIIAKIKK